MDLLEGSVLHLQSPTVSTRPLTSPLKTNKTFPPSLSGQLLPTSVSPAETEGPQFSPSLSLPDFTTALQKLDVVPGSSVRVHVVTESVLSEDHLDTRTLTPNVPCYGGWTDPFSHNPRSSVAHREGEQWEWVSSDAGAPPTSRRQATPTSTRPREPKTSVQRGAHKGQSFPSPSLPPHPTTPGSTPCTPHPPQGLGRVRSVLTQTSWRTLTVQLPV